MRLRLLRLPMPSIKTSDNNSARKPQELYGRRCLVGLQLYLSSLRETLREEYHTTAAVATKLPGARSRRITQDARVAMACGVCVCAVSLRSH